MFKVARKDSIMDVPVIAELGADGDGKIGAQLATYAQVRRVKASGIVDAGRKAGDEFGRMMNMVSSGTISCI